MFVSNYGSEGVVIESRVWYTVITTEIEHLNNQEALRTMIRDGRNEKTMKGKLTSGIQVTMNSYHREIYITDYTHGVTFTFDELKEIQGLAYLHTGLVGEVKYELSHCATLTIEENELFIYCGSAMEGMSITYRDLEELVMVLDMFVEEA